MKFFKFLSKYFIFVCLGFIALYIFLNNYFDNSTQENYRYNIGTITKIDYIGKSSSNKVLFNYYQNDRLLNGSYQFNNDSTLYYKSKIGSRFLIKINNNEWVNRLFFTSRLYINKPVPDSVKEAPSEGWKELPAWAK